MRSTTDICLSARPVIIVVIVFVSPLPIMLARTFKKSSLNTMLRMNMRVSAESYVQAVTLSPTAVLLSSSNVVTSTACFESSTKKSSSRRLITSTTLPFLSLISIPPIRLFISSTRFAPPSSPTSARRSVRPYCLPPNLRNALRIVSIVPAGSTPSMRSRSENTGARRFLMIGSRLFVATRYERPATSSRIVLMGALPSLSTSPSVPRRPSTSSLRPAVVESALSSSTPRALKRGTSALLYASPPGSVTAAFSPSGRSLIEPFAKMKSSTPLRGLRRSITYDVKLSAVMPHVNVAPSAPRTVHTSAHVAAVPTYSAILAFSVAAANAAGARSMPRISLSVLQRSAVRKPPIALTIIPMSLSKFSSVKRSLSRR